MDLDREMREKLEALSDVEKREAIEVLAKSKDAPKRIPGDKDDARTSEEVLASIRARRLKLSGAFPDPVLMVREMREGR